MNFTQINTQKLLRFCERKSNYNIAEDIAQETLIIAFRDRKNFESRNGALLSSWIFGIANNLCKQLKKKMTFLSIEELEENEDLGNHPDYLESIVDFDKNIYQSELEDLIYCAMVDLPDILKSVLRLFYWHDNDHSQIAKKLNIPIGTVKSRLSRGRVEVAKNLIAMGFVYYEK